MGRVTLAMLSDSSCSGSESIDNRSHSEDSLDPSDDVFHDDNSMINYHELYSDISKMNIAAIRAATSNPAFDITATVAGGNTLFHAIIVGLHDVQDTKQVDALMATVNILLGCDGSKKIITQGNSNGDSFEVLLTSYQEHPVVNDSTKYQQLISKLKLMHQDDSYASRDVGPQIFDENPVSDFSGPKIGKAVLAPADDHFKMHLAGLYNPGEYEA